MAEAVRRLKINKRYASAACPWCGDTLALGEDGAVCEACETPHHARCWDQNNGCNGDAQCVNRPLRQLPDVQAPKPLTPRLEPGESICPTCGDVVIGFCYRCRHMTTSNLEYTGPRETCQDAKDALRYAIIGLFCFGIILGPIAFKKGWDAKKAIARDPTLEGDGIATVAMVLAAIDLVLFVLYFLGNLAR